jgi:hypothetical protein
VIWEELIQKLRSSFRFSTDTPEVVGVTWGIPGDPPDKQEVRFERGEVDGIPWLVLTADVFERTRLDAERACRRSAGMATGAIVLLGERWLVRYATPLPPLAWDDLSRAMQVVAAEAARLRREHQAAPPPVGGYVD